MTHYTNSFEVTAKENGFLVELDYDRDGYYTPEFVFDTRDEVVDFLKGVKLVSRSEKHKLEAAAKEKAAKKDRVEEALEALD